MQTRYMWIQVLLRYQVLFLLFLLQMGVGIVCQAFSASFLSIVKVSLFKN